MEINLIDPAAITLDGCMDEAVWESAVEYSGFKRLGAAGVPMETNLTSFKILPCADRIFIGIKCMESDMQRLRNAEDGAFSHVDSIELFLAPSGTSFDFYQFMISAKGSGMQFRYYEEGGNIQPDRYAPDCKSAVYYGEDYWSVEVELPFTAFYMTSQARWTNTWLVNVARTHMGLDGHNGRFYSTWSTLSKGFKDPEHFQPIEGFPTRDPKNELKISSVMAEINEQKGEIYRGEMKLLVENTYGGTFELTSDHSDPVTVKLEPGINEITAPCYFDELTRFRVSVALKRLEDGVVFKRRYPVFVTYEPIVIRFTAPEYRSNFYPGQDHSQIIGRATANKPITLKLEGPGIETQVISPDADGNFAFKTPDFEFGDAYLTATIDGYELVRKIRNLPPTGHMMTWISGGNLIVNGEPILRRNMYAQYYMGGTAFKRKYDADELYMTKEIVGQTGHLEPGRMIKGVEAPGGEATLDARPTPEMLALVDKVMENNKDRDFAYYYISDEPECRGLSRIYLEHMYNYIAEKDPYHVILTASRNAGELVNIADWFETHPYINPYTDENGKRHYARNGMVSMGKFVDDIIKLNRPDKCIGFLPTCYAAAKLKREPYPTFDEYICHTWAAMVHGGKTLFPYAYHDLNDRASMYEGTRYIFSSFAALDKLVLLGERTELLKNDDIHAVLYTGVDEQMFVIVNMSGAPQKVTLDSISGQWHHFRHNEIITSNVFELKPLEVIIATSQVKDAGLPTYQEVATLIDELEYKRTRNGSLLFERRKDIGITASTKTVGWCGKLFDGVSDNLGWSQIGDMEKFMELDLTKIKPTFTKVVVSGFGLEEMELKVRNGEDLTAPAIADIQKEEFATTFLLSEAINPESVRLEFKARSVELYEIELF